jgi:C4-dicarboxylate transporter, DctM subunit
VRFHPNSAPQATRAPPGEFGQALSRCGPLSVLFFGTLGGMYLGIVTATEAAAVGAFGAFLIAILRGKLRAGRFWAVMAEVTQVTAMIYMLIFGALIFAYFCELTGIASKAAELLGTLNWSPLALIAIILITFVGLGTFMDSYAVMIITIPIVTPLVLGAGYDILWWGVVNLFVIEIGAISPPFGLNMFVLKTIGDVPLKSIFYGSAWFCIAAIITLAILVVFPSLSLWLPSTM